MVRCFVLFFIVCCVNEVFCTQDSGGAQSEPVAAQGATSCGCEHLKRVAAVEPVEDSTVSADPALKYSKGANERLQEAQGDDENILSQVSHLFVL